MKAESVKKLLDACCEAAHIEYRLPPLPRGITPRCVRVLECAALAEKEGRRLCVSDISDALGVTRPGITKVLREPESLGYVEKERDPRDSRIVYAALTDKGRALVRTCVFDYHDHLAEVLGDITDDKAGELADLIHWVSERIGEDSARRKARAAAALPINKED